MNAYYSMKLMWIDLNNLSQFTSTDPRIYGPDQEDATFYRKFGNCGIVEGLILQHILQPLTHHSFNHSNNSMYPQ